MTSDISAQARNLVRSARFFRNQWNAVYRYSGGLPAFWRCVVGTIRLKNGGSFTRESSSESPYVDCVTFSVIPNLTRLWLQFVDSEIPEAGRRLVVGDCSGGLNTEGINTNQKNIWIRPLLNYSHGEKLDLFMGRVCDAEYVVISDDDVYWLDSLPWEYALDCFAGDEDVAVVSLMPRLRVARLLRNQLEKPMGAYCLVIRREIWQKEGLSFRSFRAPSSRDCYQWDQFYDTGDYANIQLLKRGYKVHIAPKAIRHHLVTFRGISLWNLRFRRYGANITNKITWNTIKKDKAVSVLFATQGLSEISVSLSPHKEQSWLVEPELLRQVEPGLTAQISQDRMREIKQEVEYKLGRIRATLTKTKDL